MEPEHRAPVVLVVVVLARSTCSSCFGLVIYHQGESLSSFPSFLPQVEPVTETVSGECFLGSVVQRWEI